MKHLSKNLYSFKQLNQSSWEVKLADVQHPVFKAHFESNPLLPAFLQIDIMGDILDKRLVKINRSKFKLPILPNDIVRYEITKIVDNNYTVKILKENEIVSELKLVYS